MENLDLAHFYLPREESRDMIEFLAKKRKIKNYKRKSSNELLQTIKENKDSEQQSRNKKIDIIREKLKDLGHNFFKIGLKEITKNFYNIEKRNQFDSKRTNKYLDESDEKILNLNKYYYNDYEYKGINSIQNLFKYQLINQIIIVNKNYS